MDASIGATLTQQVGGVGASTPQLPSHRAEGRKVRALHWPSGGHVGGDPVEIQR